MPRFVAKRYALLFVTSMFVAVLFMGSMPSVQAADAEDRAMLEEKLAEAQRLLDADKASKDATAEKKRMIDERLAAQQQRETEIFEELKLLCEEQEKLSKGTLISCMAKLDN